MMKAHSHLSDDQLIELCLGGGDRVAAPGCAACEARRADLAALLDEVVRRRRHEADAAFPAERLARQQARILHRLEQDGRPGRLIAFPGHTQEPSPLRVRPRTRWIAGAAAAGLVIGLLAGHLAHDIPGTAGVPAAARAARARSRRRCAPSPRRSPRTNSSARSRWPSTAPARARRCEPLHDVTPRAWEVNNSLTNLPAFIDQP